MLYGVQNRAPWSVQKFLWSVIWYSMECHSVSMECLFYGVQLGVTPITNLLHFWSSEKDAVPRIQNVTFFENCRCTIWGFC